MIHHDHHHLRTYLIFFFVSTFLIGSLAYFYAPLSHTNLGSSALSPVSDTGQQKEDFLSDPVVPSADNTPLAQEDESERSAKRMRFTSLLLKYQSELQELQSEKMDGLGSTHDPELEKKIGNLTNRIENLEKIIASLSQ